MTRIIRLTESDLTRIVRRVIKEETSPSNEYVNDPDLKKIESDITMLNGVVSKFKSPYNLKSYELRSVIKSDISILQLVKYKKDSSGRSVFSNVVFETRLGQSKVGNFNSGSHFSDDSFNKVDTTEAKTLMTTIVNDIVKFSNRFPGSKITLWAANSITIERNPKK